MGVPSNELKFCEDGYQFAWGEIACNVLPHVLGIDMVNEACEIVDVVADLSHVFDIGLEVVADEDDVSLECFIVLRNGRSREVREWVLEATCNNSRCISDRDPLRGAVHVLIL